MQIALSLEIKSEHPLARAVIQKGEQLEIQPGETDEFTALPGSGLMAVMDGEKICGGNLTFAAEQGKISPEMEQRAYNLSEEGKTPLFFMKSGKLAGIIAVCDTIREDSRQAVEELKNMGIRVVMLTGDNRKTARAAGAQAGVDEVMAEVLPQEKERVVRELMQQGKTAMAGDGINDAPALTRADTGIAVGAGTDIAIDSADIVIMKSRLRDIPAAIRLSRASLKNIHQNLFWAFIYNVIGIPLAAGVWIPVFGWKLNPMFGAAAMSLSSFCVVSNALRLNWFKPYDPGHDKKIKLSRKHKEEKVMKKTIKIEGMMCGHCEAAVKKALEQLPQVAQAEVSHQAAEAVVTLSSPIDDKLLKEAVEAKDYKVISIS
jgi:Cu2+-exporting ATPase